MSLARLLLPTAAALAATVLAAGCGGTGGHGPAVATDHVSMAKSYRFDPDVIRIKAGETVTWTNNDNFTHTVKVEGQDDHKVGRGECWDLGEAALKQAGASTSNDFGPVGADTDYVWGDPIDIATPKEMVCTSGRTYCIAS